MRVLAINGSPKGDRSNSWQLASAFLDGMRDVLGDGGLELREVKVRDRDIGPCLGCFGCWRSEEGTCRIHDDMAEVIEARVWADVTLWVFPLYWFSVPGPLKNLIDRQLPMALPFMEERADGMGSGSHPARYAMAGKRNVVISTCGFYSAEGNYDGAFSLFDHMCGKGAYDAVVCGQGELFRVPELSARCDEYLAIVERAGAEFARGGISAATRAELAQLLYPREAFEAMADASWGISRDTGQREDEAVSFTRQMAALYNPGSFDGTERVIEMRYTDRDVSAWVVLGRDGARVVTDGSVRATTVIETPFSVWQEIAQGKVSGTDALAEHRYRVTGDFDVMIRWEEFFGGLGTAAVAEPTKDDHKGRPANMLALLIPWVAYWVAMSVWPGTTGAAVTLACCAASMLLFISTERTPYEGASLACVSALVAASLVGVPRQALLPASYALFGGLWLVSCLLRIPLCAYYSKEGYGGERAYANAIFMRTNRIICVAWGVTYLAAALAALLMAGGEVAWLVPVVNNVLPIPAAVFTAWFQRWYPVHVAQG